MNQLPILYKRTSTGAIETWRVWVEAEIPSGHGIVRTEHGQLGGKLVTSTDVISTGKNVGKANETSAIEQAFKEAQAKYTKQLKKGYVTTMEAAAAGEVDSVIEGGFTVMLAHRYDKSGHKMPYPAFVSRKLDGLRLGGVIDDGVCTLWSRTRKPIYSLPHIQRALEAKFPTGHVKVDGEAYNHAYRDDFEKIMELVRPQQPVEGHEIVEYHIFDLPSYEHPFVVRYAHMEHLFGNGPSPLVLVKNVLVQDEEAMFEEFQAYLSEGYEGAMVRGAESVYEPKRSYGLLKVKTMLDDEFPIVGAHEGRGKMAGKAIFSCLAKEGKEFDVKMKGALADLEKYLHDPSLWQGKQLTVQYQNLSGDGIPRFPVGIRIRQPE